MTTQTLRPVGIHFPSYLQRAGAALVALFGTPSGRAGRRDDLAVHADANQVRELAYSYSKTDPGFASDLYAAAARHEGHAD